MSVASYLLVYLGHSSNIYNVYPNTWSRIFFWFWTLRFREWKSSNHFFLFLFIIIYNSHSTELYAWLSTWGILDFDWGVDIFFELRKISNLIVDLIVGAWLVPIILQLWTNYCLGLSLVSYLWHFIAMRVLNNHPF